MMNCTLKGLLRFEPCQAVLMLWILLAAFLACPSASWSQEKAPAEAALANEPQPLLAQTAATSASEEKQTAPDEKMDEETAAAIRSILDEAGSCGECTEKILQEFYRNP